MACMTQTTKVFLLTHVEKKTKEKKTFQVQTCLGEKNLYMNLAISLVANWEIPVSRAAGRGRWAVHVRFGEGFRKVASYRTSTSEKTKFHQKRPKKPPNLSFVDPF